ncbi:MAG: Crp/Fnr family transcriptional regulator [Armatimonadota bacterium]|nr:Crp/Fnr family transcriptional regulator [Armatimonadota bacterium]
MKEDDLTFLLPSAKRVFYPKNSIVFHENEQCRGFYIVEEGAVKVYKESGDARQHVLHIAVPGDCFGEAALFLDTGYPASAAAVKDSSLVLLRKQEFLDVLNRNPAVALALMGSMALWARRLVTSIERLTLKDAGQRLADYLLSMCSGNSSHSQVVQLDVTKQMLASHLGIAGETLSRLLARFEAEGIIEVSGRVVKLLSIPQLRKIAAGIEEPAEQPLSGTGL